MNPFPNARTLFKRILPVLCLLILIWMYSLDSHFKRRETPSKSALERYEFEYVISNDICADGDLYMLILVHSAPDHFEHRRLIRSAWGSPDLPRIRIAFLLALSDEFRTDISAENELHRDIVQGNFVDSYRNLTYKHVMGLSWASEHCRDVRYLLKMDDDIFVDVYQFVDYIESRLRYYDLDNNLACYFQDRMPVVRDPVSKWFVSKSEFEPDTFTNYCSGWAYLTTPAVARRLYRSAKEVPYFWVDDVHLTGTVAKLANVTRIRLNPLFALEAGGLVEWTRSKRNLRWDKVFVPTWGDLELSRRAHKKAWTCHRTKCRCCFKLMTTPKAVPSTKPPTGVAEIVPYNIS